MACLSTALHWVSFDRSFYAAQFSALGILEDLRVDLPTLMGYTEVLLDYLAGDAPSPNVIATVRGRNGWLYGEREYYHLKDVRVLIALNVLIRNSSAMAALLLLALLFKLKQVALGAKAYLYTTGAIFALLLLLAGLVAVDFTHYFTVFHLIAFDNDLWLLDPATEYLIRMVPEPFFVSAALRIALFSAGSFAFLALVILFGILFHAHKVNSKQQILVKSPL